ncbi:CENP-B protein 2, partial [Choanephora cucurbitarum]
MPYHLPNQVNSSKIRPSDLTPPNRARSLLPRKQQIQAGKKRMRLTDAEKLELGYRYYEVNPKISQESLCAWAKREFQLEEEPTQSTISRALQKYSSLKESPDNKLRAFSSKGAKFPLLESKLADFVKRMEDSSFAINSHSLKAEAERLCMLEPLLLNGEPMPAFSNGWFDRFMKRNML